MHFLTLEMLNPILAYLLIYFISSVICPPLPIHCFSIFFTYLLMLNICSSHCFSIQGPANLFHDTSYWQREHEWRQDIAVVTKWLSGVSPI